MEKIKYCTQCGGSMPESAQFCPGCGAKQGYASGPGPVQSNSGSINTEWVVTLLLVWFFGYLGVHRFYHRRFGSGLLMLFTLGGFGIWYVIDLIMVIIGRFRDDSDRYITVKE